MRIKPALDMSGKLHQNVAHIEYGVAGGWRRVYFADGSRNLSMSTTELVKAHGVDPFVNVNPLQW